MGKRRADGAQLGFATGALEGSRRAPGARPIDWRSVARANCGLGSGPARSPPDALSFLSIFCARASTAPVSFPPFKASCCRLLSALIRCGFLPRSILCGCLSLNALTLCLFQPVGLLPRRFHGRAAAAAAGGGRGSSFCTDFAPRSPQRTPRTSDRNATLRGCAQRAAAGLEATAQSLGDTVGLFSPRSRPRAGGCSGAATRYCLLGASPRGCSGHGAHDARRGGREQHQRAAEEPQNAAVSKSLLDILQVLQSPRSLSKRRCVSVFPRSKCRQRRGRGGGACGAGGAA